MKANQSPHQAIGSVPDNAAERLADYILRTGLKPLPLPKEFYYASLPICVIDAVYSIGVSYSSTRNTVARFCDRQNWTMSLPPGAERLNGEHRISGFLKLIDGGTADQLADDLFGNRQRTSSRSGILKAEAVRRFASALFAEGIDDFGDLSMERLAPAERTVRQIPGQRSGISFDYFRMLAGDDQLIKPDRMVQRYVARAIGGSSTQITPDQVRDTVQQAVTHLSPQGPSWTPRVLDFAIWEAERANRYQPADWR